jgi:hypothetical protein
VVVVGREGEIEREIGRWGMGGLYSFRAQTSHTTCKLYVWHATHKL